MARSPAVKLSLMLLALTWMGCERSPPPAPAFDGPVAGWPHYGGDAGGARHSPLTQITPENVSRLEVAWEHHSGDILDGTRTRGKSAFEATPILRDRTLYYCSPINRVFALDAETGAERWVFDPKVDPGQVWTLTCRGVAAFEDRQRVEGDECVRRIFTATIDARLFAVDAATGRPCADFAGGKSVDLKRGVGEVRPGEYGVTSAPTVIGDVVAVGALVGDNRRMDAPAGVIRGYDARTGELRWAFDTAPPGREPLPPLPDGSPQYHLGTPNAWSIFSADPERDLLFVPTGNTNTDFYGGERKGLDFYSSSLLAIQGATGELVWRFQTVHHDLWDYDVSSQPTLIDVEKDGKTIPAVAQATKMGHVFVLNRDTGEPVWPVEERPVPRGDAPGETYSPTQPIPTMPPPLHPHHLTPEEAFGITPWDRGKCADWLRRVDNRGIFTPPSLRGSLEYPGVAGGMNWGGVSFDPDRQLLVMPINKVAVVMTLVPRDEIDPKAMRDSYGGVSLQLGTPFGIRQQVLLSPWGIPCVPPPWGTLMAFDLRKGEIAWEVPFGTTRDLAPWPIWFELGTPSAGGAALTASGVAFIGATLDGYFRAYDVETGEVLWKTHLPAGGQATPMTYRLDPDGRQFVVIAAGGHGAMRTRLGDSLIAFALPVDDD